MLFRLVLLFEIVCCFSPIALILLYVLIAALFAKFEFATINLTAAALGLFGIYGVMNLAIVVLDSTISVTKPSLLWLMLVSFCLSIFAFLYQLGLFSFSGISVGLHYIGVEYILLIAAFVLPLLATAHLVYLARDYLLQKSHG